MWNSVLSSESLSSPSIRSCYSGTTCLCQPVCATPNPLSALLESLQYNCLSGILLGAASAGIWYWQLCHQYWGRRCKYNRTCFDKALLRWLWRPALKHYSLLPLITIPRIAQSQRWLCEKKTQRVFNAKANVKAVWSYMDHYDCVNYTNMRDTGEGER